MKLESWRHRPTVILATRLIIGLAIAITFVIIVAGDVNQGKKIFTENAEIFLAVAFIALVIPWERIHWENIRLFKAGPFQFELETKQIEITINKLDIERVEDQQLREMLLSNIDKTAALKGSRILWIDDNPHKIMGARRLLRVIGLDIIMSASSEMAEQILETDNDFDLIISDVQRIGESYKTTDGIEIHEGVNFIVKKLLTMEDPFIKSIPVIFYAAYNWERLVMFTEPAREKHSNVDICNDVISLIKKVIVHLEESRRQPIIYRTRKEPTSVYPG